MARPDTFTAEEIEWLIENYSTSSWDEILSNINKTKTQIISKAHYLNIKRSVEYSAYTKEEDELIRAVYDYSTDSTLMKNVEKLVNERLNKRTVSSVLNRARRLGCRVRHEWTNNEDDFLRKNYLTMTVKELKECLENHSRESVYNRLRHLGLTDAPMFAYSDSDKQFVRDNYLHMSDIEIGDVLHRKPQSIKELRRKLRLYRRDPEETNYLSVLRFIQANNKDWKKESMNNCGYKCVITHGKFDDIHHLYSKNLILQDALQNLGFCIDDIDINKCSDSIKESILKEFLKEQNKHPLGVCLTKELHRSFHIQYGFGNNTPEQFEKFVDSITQNDAYNMHIA